MFVVGFYDVGWGFGVVVIWWSVGGLCCVGCCWDCCCLFWLV